MIQLKKAQFILRPLSTGALICLIWLFWALDALGQSTPAPQPGKGGIPPANVPAQRVPASPTGANPAQPSSTTNPTPTSEESELEQELNQRRSQPNRLGPAPSRTNPLESGTVSPKTPSPQVAKPAGRDTTKSLQPRQAVTARDSARADSANIKKQATAKTPAPKPTTTTPRSQTVSPARPNQPQPSVAQPTVPKPQRPDSTKLRQPDRVVTTRDSARTDSTKTQTAKTPQIKPATTTPGSQSASPSQAGQGRLRPGIVSPNTVKPEGRDTIRIPQPTQAVAATDSAKADSAQTEDAFRTTVKYTAKDSTLYSADGQTVELFGDASVVYGEISLKADYIKLNYLTNEVYAKGRYDSTGQKLIGRPIFQDGADKYDTKEIRYNFKTKKGKIQGVITTQGEGNIRGQTVKKDADDNLYIGRAIYTTCNLAVPHFHINASKLKVIHNKQVVAGPFNLVINQVPLPIGLPFGFFPFPKKKEIGVSGILVPQYGQEPNGRGYYLRDGGYYWAVNENLGIQFRGQIYSRGSWGVGVSSAYNKRYRYSGGVDLRFNRNRNGDPVDRSDARNDFAITWSHSPVPRGRGTFSANVNVSSNSYNQFNAVNPSQYTSNVAGSSVQYSRTFGQYVRAGANLRVNQQFGQVNQVTNVRENGRTDISSDFNLGVNQISPFALRGGTGRWFESFRVGLDISGSIVVSNTVRRQIDTTGLGIPIYIPRGARAISTVQSVRDSIARADSIRLGLVSNRNTLPADPNLIPFNLQTLDLIWRNKQIQARYSIPVSLPNFKILRYINLTPGFSLQGDIYTKKLDYVYLADKDSVRVDTSSNGLYPSYNFSANLSMNTRFYGTYFIRGKRIEAIRHTVAPSISFSYVPDFTNPIFGQFQYLDVPESSSFYNLPRYRRTLSRFRGLGGSGGSASSTQSAFLSFGIVNQLEMKVRTRSDSAGQEFKKIPIFDNLSITGSYNFLAPDYKLSPIAVNANTQIFKNISFNFSSTFDPYAYRAYGGTPVYPLPAATAGQSPFPPSSYSPYILYTEEYDNQEYIRVPERFAIQEGQGLLRLTNLQAYVSARFAPKQADKPKQSDNASAATMQAINANPELYVDFNIPWSINVSYTFGLTKLTPLESQVIQALTLTGDLSLTPKWKITISSGYDFQFKRPTLTTIGINRDLHCWEMAFNWTPYAGSNQRLGNYSFDLRARSSILQELKLSRRRSFYDYGGFYGR